MVHYPGADEASQLGYALIHTSIQFSYPHHYLQAYPLVPTSPNDITAHGPGAVRQDQAHGGEQARAAGVGEFLDFQQVRSPTSSFLALPPI